jgi:hypothetical protein
MWEKLKTRPIWHNILKFEVGLVKHIHRKQEKRNSFKVTVHMHNENEDDL